MCIYGHLYSNPRYKPNKKNGGNIPPVNDYRVLRVPVGCGKCIECKKQKAREWQVRMLEDIKANKNGKFITLTFSNEKLKEIADKITGVTGYNLDNAIATKAVRLWLERWRKKTSKSLRHWLITELGHGNTEHVHLHGIVWTNEDYTKIRDSWQYGYIWPRNKQDERRSYVSARTVNYIMKYIVKIDKQHKEYEPAILTSAGIGSNYIHSHNYHTNEYNGKYTKQHYTTDSGHKISLPKYYRNKRYSDDEREQLWINMLDKEERYILGQKIDIRKDDRQYYEALEEARRKNKVLGYGDDSVNWERKVYENERRMLKHKERGIEDAKTNKSAAFKWIID